MRRRSTARISLKGRFMTSAPSNVIVLCLSTLLLLSSCAEQEQATQDKPVTVIRADRNHGLTQARDGFATSLRPSAFGSEDVPPPPAELFQLVHYESSPGQLPAYITTDPQDGKKRPAIVWITGGDCNSIGEVWEDAPEENDQTAAAYRKAGIVMMFPSLRGGNANPGRREGFFGEVEDILAAAEFLSRQPHVDGGRIYLGGHSTGGTLALLVAECSPRFRAVFSFGPVDDIAGYGDQYCPFDLNNAREVKLRSPLRWLQWIACRTFVFEGDGEVGNIASLRQMKNANANAWVQFFPVEGADHFSALAPTNQLIAKKILSDKGSACAISFTDDELSRPFKR